MQNKKVFLKPLVSKTLKKVKSYSNEMAIVTIAEFVEQ